MAESRLRVRATVANVTALLLLVLSSPLAASQVRVKLELPVGAEIDLAGRDSLAIAPFLAIRQEGEGDPSFRGTSIDLETEFERYLLKTLRRDTDLEIRDLDRVDYPTFDLQVLARDRSFWRALGAEHGSDLILAGSIDFDVQDQSGYQLEEYVSPFDGRTYHRQVLVEETGFAFDILVYVFNGATGELLHRDNFKDFQKVEGSDVDPVAGMFRNLASLEDRIVGLFTTQQVEQTRWLHKP